MRDWDLRRLSPAEHADRVCQRRIAAADFKYFGGRRVAVGNQDGGATRRVGGTDAGKCVFENRTPRRRNPDTLGRQQKDVWRGLAVDDVTSGDDRIE